MDPRKLTLKIVPVLAALLAFGAPRAEAIPPGFKPCVQYCPTSPLYAYHNCWMHCYVEWCRSSVPPQWREGCRTLLHPGISAGLLVKDAELATGFEVTDAGLPYFDFSGRSDLHLTAVDLREDSNPVQAIAVWYVPAGAPDAEWTQVGKGSRSAAGGWDLLVVLDTTGDRSPTGTIAFEVQRSMPSEQDADYALCPVAHASRVTFDGLSNYALGAATISVEDDGTGSRRLPVRNLGSSGEDGVAVDLRSSGSRFRPAFFDIFFEVAPDTQPDASLNARVLQGDVDGDGIDDVLAHAQADAAADGVDLKVKLPWLPAADVTRSLQLFLGDAPVGSVNGVHGEEVGKAVVSSARPSPWPRDIHIHFDPFWIELTWTGVISTERAAGSTGVDIALDGQLFHCDRLRVTLDGVSPPRSKLSSFLMTASGISSITVNEEGVRSSPPVVLDGLPHHALGNADVSIEDDGTGERRLPVRNLGSSGEDGVSIDLGTLDSRRRPSFFDIFFETIAADPRSSSLAARVAAADIDGDGKSDLAADASATGTEAGIELRNTFPWAAADAPVSLSYYLGTALVGKSSSTNGAVAGLVVADPSDPQAQAKFPFDLHIQILDHEPWIIIKVTFTGRLDDSMARGAGGSTGAWVQIDGAPVFIDRLEMSTGDGSLNGPVQLESLDLTAAGIPEIVITGENHGELVTEPSFRRGDANGDRRVDIGDSIFLLGYMFTGTKAPDCMDAADVNDTGKVDLSDPISALNYLFLGAKAPPAPGVSTCGTDPTADALACGAYTACS